MMAAKPLLGQTLLESFEQNSDVDFDQIPVINLSGLSSESLVDRLEVARKVRDACIQVGFFYVKNHGIPEEVIGNAFDASRNLFGLPKEEKMEIHISKNESFKGYEDINYTTVDPNTKGGELRSIFRRIVF
jgi:isopenicillin N synthase-like dioxygenase